MLQFGRPFGHPAFRVTGGCACWNSFRTGQRIEIRLRMPKQATAGVQVVQICCCKIGRNRSRASDQDTSVRRPGLLFQAVREDHWISVFSERVCFGQNSTLGESHQGFASSTDYCALRSKMCRTLECPLTLVSQEEALLARADAADLMINRDRACNLLTLRAAEHAKQVLVAGRLA